MTVLCGWFAVLRDVCLVAAHTAVAVATVQASTVSMDTVFFVGEQLHSHSYVPVPGSGCQPSVALLPPAPKGASGTTDEDFVLLSLCVCLSARVTDKTPYGGGGGRGLLLANQIFAQFLFRCHFCCETFSQRSLIPPAMSPTNRRTHRERPAGRETSRALHLYCT